MDLLTIDVKDLTSLLPKKVWDEIKEDINRLGSIEKLVDGDKAIRFSKSYMLFRRQKHHKVRLVKKGHPHWRLVLEITRFIDEVFCVENDISYKRGVKLFLQYGWDLGCISLKDFLYGAEKIGKEAELQEEIKNDKNRDLTEELLQIYHNEGFPRNGSVKFNARGSKHKVYFIRIAEVLSKRKIKTSKFMYEFFEEWSWVGGWPKPSLLMSQYTLDLIDKLEKDLNILKPETKGIYVKVIKKNAYT